MKDLKGTKTEQNLQAAFAGESQAHTKYLYYASKAKKDGYVQMGNIFEETARNEKEHAKLWFKYLHGGEVPGTTTNLADAAAGENYEWTDMYATFAKEARGFCGNCGKIRNGGCYRKTARGTLSQIVEEYRRQRGVLARGRVRLAMLELRTHCDWQKGTRTLPRV